MGKTAVAIALSESERARTPGVCVAPANGAGTGSKGSDRSACRARVGEQRHRAAGGRSAQYCRQVAQAICATSR